MKWIWIWKFSHFGLLSVQNKLMFIHPSMLINFEPSKIYFNTNTIVHSSCCHNMHTIDHATTITPHRCHSKRSKHWRGRLLLFDSVLVTKWSNLVRIVCLFVCMLLVYSMFNIWELKLVWSGFRHTQTHTSNQTCPYIFIFWTANT